MLIFLRHIGVIWTHNPMKFFVNRAGNNRIPFFDNSHIFSLDKNAFIIIKQLHLFYIEIYHNLFFL